MKSLSTAPLPMPFSPNTPRSASRRTTPFQANASSKLSAAASSTPAARAAWRAAGTPPHGPPQKKISFSSPSAGPGNQGSPRRLPAAKYAASPKHRHRNVDLYVGGNEA